MIEEEKRRGVNDQLVTYIRSVRELGFTDPIIEQTLHQAGWPEVLLTPFFRPEAADPGLILPYDPNDAKPKGQAVAPPPSQPTTPVRPISPAPPQGGMGELRLPAHQPVPAIQPMLPSPEPPIVSPVHPAIEPAKVLYPVTGETASTAEAAEQMGLKPLLSPAAKIDTLPKTEEKLTPLIPTIRPGQPVLHPLATPAPDNVKKAKKEGSSSMLIVAIVVVSLVLLSVVGLYYVQKRQSALNLTPTGLPSAARTDGVYVNPTGFSLTPPTNWATDESGRDGTLVIFVNPDLTQAQAGGAIANINISQETAVSEELAPYVDRQVAALSTSLTDYKVIRRQSMTLDGQPGESVEAEYNQGGVLLHNWQVVAKQGTDVFVLTATAGKDSWETYYPTILASIKSFQFTQ